jgi:nucleotide-binding universal stress UspA family protein
MTLRNILVATDLTVGSELALERTLSFCSGCTVTLLHVLRAALPDPLRMQLHSVIEGYLADRAMYSPGVEGNSVRPSVATGHPTTTIVTEAVSRRAELIVVGEPAVVRRPHLFVGTTAECVARLTDRPILMIKRAGSGAYQRIVAALDGSPAAVRALGVAVALAPQAQFRIIYASTSSPTEADRRNQSLREVKERISAEIEKAFAQISLPQSDNAIIEILETSPYTALRHACESSDLLVMGTHSKAYWTTSLELGRLAHHMLAEAACDVLVSPP